MPGVKYCPKCHQEAYRLVEEGENMEVRKCETPEGKLLRIAFVRTVEGENLREEVNKWIMVNYPKMKFKQIWKRLFYMTNDTWVILME